MAPQPLSILYIVHTFYPESHTGTEKFVFNMARSMQSKGHRVKVVTYSKAAPESFPNSIGEVAFQEYLYEGVPVLAYRHLRMDPGETFDIGNPDLIAFAQETINREKPDVVHIGHPMRAMEFMQVCAGAGIKYVVTLTDFWMICPKGIMLQTSGALCDGPAMGENCQLHCQIPNVQQRMGSHIPLLRGAAKIVSPSVALANLFKHTLPDLNVDILNHGMNADTIQPNERTYQSGDSLTLFYGGSLTPHKGVHLIVQAMSAIPSDRLKLKIYGSGPADYTEPLQQSAAADSRISLCGSYSEQDIRHIYQDVDIAVVPSIWYENYPLALHEALASHVPALVSDVGGMAEKVADGFNGFTFRVGDASHLAERIEVLLDNPVLLNDFKNNMRQVRFPSIEEEAAAYESIYRSVAPARLEAGVRVRPKSGARVMSGRKRKSGIKTKFRIGLRIRFESRTRSRIGSRIRVKPRTGIRRLRRKKIR